MRQWKKISLVALCISLAVIDRAGADGPFSMGPIMLFFIHSAISVNEWAGKVEKLLMVTATLAVAYFTWTLYRTAREQLQASEKSIAATQRPWVHVEVGVVGPILITDTEVRLIIGFKLKNVGKSPALNVDIEPLLVSTFVEQQEDHPLEKMKTLRQEIKNRKRPPDSVIGGTIFPDETYVQNTNLGIKIEDIKSKLPSTFPKTHFGLELMGFVSYRTPFDTETHYTYFGGSIGKRDIPNRPDIMLAISFDDIRLDPGTFGLWLSPFFSGQAN